MRPLNHILLAGSLILSQESFSQTQGISKWDTDSIVAFTCSWIEDVINQETSSEEKKEAGTMKKNNLAPSDIVVSEKIYQQNVANFKKRLLDKLTIKVWDFNVTIVDLSSLGMEKWALVMQKNIEVNQYLIPGWTGKLFIWTWETKNNASQIFIQAKINF